MATLPSGDLDCGTRLNTLSQGGFRIFQLFTPMGPHWPIIQHFQQASPGRGHLLFVDGGRLHHHLHPLHRGGAAAGRGGQHQVPQRRLHHRAHRQFHSDLFHCGIPAPSGHLSQQAAVHQGPSQRRRLRRHRPVLRLHPPRGFGGLRDNRENRKDHPVGPGDEGSKVVQTGSTLCGAAVPTPHSEAGLPGNEQAIQRRLISDSKPI